MKRDWSKLGPKLEGKIHIYVGEADNFFLNNAVYLVDDFLKTTRDPFYGGEVGLRTQAEHCWCGDHTRPQHNLPTPLPPTSRPQDRRTNPEKRATRSGFEELAVLAGLPKKGARRS